MSDSEQYWRGFQQATYNKPGSLSTADELIATTKALAKAEARVQTLEAALRELRSLPHDRPIPRRDPT